MKLADIIVLWNCNKFPDDDAEKCAFDIIGICLNYGTDDLYLDPALMIVECSSKVERRDNSNVVDFRRTSRLS